jgi:quercetin dioxygenase-like cupin family protein
MRISRKGCWLVSDDVLGTFNLSAEMQRLRPVEGESGRRAKVLVRTARLRVVLVVMRAGAALHEHTAPGPITIHALAGRFLVHVGAEEITIASGGIVSVDADVRHAVAAIEDGAFLLTIGYPGDAPVDVMS